MLDDEVILLISDRKNNIGKKNTFYDVEKSRKLEREIVCFNRKYNVCCVLSDLKDDSLSRSNDMIPYRGDYQ